MKKFIIYVSTCCKVGFLPKMPGTFGSALAIFFLPVVFYSELLTLLLLVTLFILGVYASGRYATPENNDPGEVVIDELVGQLLTFYLLNIIVEMTPVIVIMAFVIFRVFDIMKPWPICYFDKNLKGGLGIMFDDILAALMTVFLWILFFLIVDY